MKAFRITSILSTAISIFFIISCSHTVKTDQNKLLIDRISQKVDDGIIAYTNKDLNPRNIEENGDLRYVESRDWTSGFYPGCLWYMYELTNNEAYKEEAHNRTVILEQEKDNGTTHDMGFKVYCSYGNGYRLTQNKEYKDVLLHSAKTLITRFNPNVGCIRSWDHHAHLWQYPVIIDNMMNLELLFWAFKETGDSTYYNIAVSHANKTMENHFRADYSTYHVINYDTITGEVLNKHTHQGYAHESSWARGQAWGLYGYTLMYRETKDEKYLNQAMEIAAFILGNPNMPDDLIPYWDFNAPNIPKEPRDASAAAVIASALFELGTYLKENSEQYYSTASKILNNLSSNEYFASNNADHHFLLEHSTGNWPDNSEIDCPIIYADYYYLEALLRKMNLESAK